MMTRSATRVIVAVVAVSLIYLIQNIINTEKNHRGRQAALPVVAFVFSLVAVVFASIFREKIQVICDSLAVLKFANILILNLLIMLLFIVVKAILCPIFSSLWKKNELMTATSIRFYEYDEGYDEWFLQRRWVDFRQMLKWFVLCAAPLCGGFLGATWTYGSESAVWHFFFPAAVLVVLGEIFDFINGFTKEQFLHDVLGDEADSRKISNFYRIREIFEELFAPQLLASHTGCEYIGKQGSTELLTQMALADDDIDRIIAEYFNLRDRDVFPDVDCIRATSLLMHRKNVVVFNPFYRDLTPYITLSMTNALFSGKKCLIVTGRKSACDDIKNWMTDSLKEYCRMRTLWRVRDLTSHSPECEVGVLNFAQFYDLKVIEANREFFRDTDFVLFIEPSLIVNTGQIALSIISEELGDQNRQPVYCICDRHTDGLVDTMSHLLRTEMTEVLAMPVSRCVCTGMAWNADGDFLRQQLFDKQTRYLGNGLELAAVAVKNQIPKVSWYSETKAPIRDIKWIAGQFHPTICRYMNLPSMQSNLYEKIEFIPTPWSTPVSLEQFVIAEDEFCNMFSTMRAYLSRGANQAFINVLSENYLLRDYMRCNRQMFMSDPNAIPSIIPDYAKTERNTLLKLLLTMTYRPVTEREVIDELSLISYETEDAFAALTYLLRKYTFAEDSIFTVQNVRTETDTLSAASTSTFSIKAEDFDEYFAGSLKNAYYILEEEKRDSGYINAKLFGHVTQTILPGQFVTYDGKYYVAKYVSPTSGVVLRRASDLYDGRKYYRQIRTYSLNNSLADEIISIRTVMDIELAMIRCNFTVGTTGYLELRENHDLRTARLVDFADDPAVDIYTRNYRNKAVLRIKLPETTEKIRFTFCMLLSEMFKSVFPDAWPYLAVVAKQPEDISGMLNYIVYQTDGDIEDDYIYVFEDSDLDLGLLEAVDRSLMQLIEIVSDFLDWHFEKMREPAQVDPVPGKVSLPEDEKRRGLVVRMFSRIRQLFGVKKEADVVIKTASEVSQDRNIAAVEEIDAENMPVLDSTDDENESPVDDDDDVVEGKDYSLDNADNEEIEDDDASSDAEQPKTLSAEQFALSTARVVVQKHLDDNLQAEDEMDSELVHIDGTDIFDNEGMPEDNEMLELSLVEAGIAPITKSRYQRECFLKFGFDEVDSRIQVEEVCRYLRLRGWSNNSLTKARKRDVLDRKPLDIDAVNHCDFCALPLSGVSFERLNDGRIRCNDCTSSAISTVNEFRELFYRVLEMMEGFYGIKYRVPINIRIENAHTLAKSSGTVFRPTTAVADRVLGFAQCKNGKYSLALENGSPRLAVMDTMVHEMTHIWQYLNWNDAEIVKLYGKDRNRDIVYEGMATWTAIQYLYQIGETFYAEQQERMMDARDDIYGESFRLYNEKYPLVKDSSLLKHTPFNVFPPL